MSLIKNTANLLKVQVQSHLLKNARNFNVNSIQYAKRWVSPTFRELLNRRQKFKSPIFTARNTFPEWNYNAEIFAFGKRLNEDFNGQYLKTAFIDSSYIYQEKLRQQKLGIESELNIADNKNLVKIGEKCISDYVQSYLKFSLPKCPEEGIVNIFNWLTSEQNLSHISKHIGTKDLILCENNEPTEKILRDVFVAVVGALNESSGEERVYNFIRDFVCTQLNQKDLTEIWLIENPFEKLKDICSEQQLGQPEPRLIGQNAVNTVLSTYYVGLYCNKKMVGKGFGESIDIAIEAASLGALCKVFGIEANQKLFNFNIEIESRTKQEKQINK